MIKRMFSLSVFFAFLLTMGYAEAATSNFEPANRLGDTPAPEIKSRLKRAPRSVSSEPGFWDKEFERSGLAELKSNILGAFGISKDATD